MGSVGFGKAYQVIDFLYGFSIWKAGLFDIQRFGEKRTNRESEKRSVFPVDYAKSLAIDDNDNLDYTII